MPSWVVITVIMLSNGSVTHHQVLNGVEFYNKSQCEQSAEVLSRNNHPAICVEKSKSTL